MKLAEALASAPKTRGRRRHLEDDLQVAVIDYLRLALDPHLYRVAAVPNGGTRNPREAARLKRMGVLAGVFDLFILGPCGMSWWIELKVLAGRLSDEQEEMILFKIRQGVPYVVARSIADVEAAVKHWRLRTRLTS